MYGELEEQNGEARLRFTRRLGHSRERVWRALTEPGELSAWFPSTIDGDRRAGGRLSFQFGAEADNLVMDGEMITFEPPSLMEFRWGTDVLRFELQEDGDGCVLTLVDTIDDYGKGARDAAGWHACLDALEAQLAGRDSRPVLETRWAEVQAAYIERFGPRASTIGPPESAT